MEACEDFELLEVLLGEVAIESISALPKQLDNVETMLAELDEINLKRVLDDDSIPKHKKSQLLYSIAYGYNVLVKSLLHINDYSTDDHPVSQEIQRLKLYHEQVFEKPKESND
ncbi:hypothetical protein PCE1_000558 [Barthelona sp. PCE]